MSFTSKNLQTTKRGGLTVLKGATFFFLGMSAVLFLTQAFDIVPSVGNRVQLIKEVLFTTDGSQNGTMGARIDGAGGDAYFAGTVTGTTICLAGDTCRTTWPDRTPGGSINNIQFNDGTTFSGSDNLVRDSVNGRLGIGTGSPAAKLHVNGSGKFTQDLIVDGRVGIGTNNPDGQFQVMGGIKAGDKITMWTDISMGMGKISAFSGLIIDTKIAGGSIETMRITKEGYVGIGTTNPSAHLDVYGDVKVLGSIEGKGGFTGSVASGYVRYYPSDSSGHTNNTGLNTDSIWYITCTAPVTATGFMIYGMTGSYLATGSAYFSMFQRGQYDTFTYHLRAGETFAIDMKNACDHIIVSKQEYGKPAINYNGGNFIGIGVESALGSG